MRFLLDTSALFALGVQRHEFHTRMKAWIMGLQKNEVPELATCSITELGFLRILAQAPQYNMTIEQGKSLLSNLKRSSDAHFALLPDENGASVLPTWVKAGKQITDGHLVGLAKAHDAVLATLDERIPGAFVIPGKR